MVAALQQLPLLALQFPMNNTPSFKEGNKLVEIKHPMIITKSDLCWLLNKSRFSLLRPYFKQHVFPHLAFSINRNLHTVSKFTEPETQVILALLFQQGRLTQARLDLLCENYGLTKDAMTEVIIKPIPQKINDRLWIITNSSK